MSHTVIIDEDCRARQFENRLNSVFRHCKIGKVIRKGIPLQTVPNFLPAISWPFMNGPVTPSPQYMNKCGCEVGTACSNAACPHRLVATC